MIEQKRYMDIVRLGHKSTQDVLNIGDYIVVMEKLDGANASFRLAEDGKTVLAFSRNTQLDENNNLRGFYQWVQANIRPEMLDEDLIYFGEWLVKHKLDYGDNANQFYLFDVYDVRRGAYLPLSRVLSEAYTLEVNTAPVFYTGKYQGLDHLMQFVGKSALGEVGEGIVVKNYCYIDRFGNQMFVKLVSEKFAEVKTKKPRDPNAPESPEAIFIKTYMTPARVEKLLLKLVDEGILREDFDLSDMPTILKNLGSRVYEDIMKEESANAPEGFEEKEARKTVGKILPIYVKQIINSRGVV